MLRQLARRLGQVAPEVRSQIQQLPVEHFNSVRGFMRRPPVVQESALWQLYQWSARPLAFLEACERRYGECFVTNIGPYRNWVFFSHPDAITQIFTANPDQFDVGRANQLLRSTTGVYSVLLLDGEPHARQRQLLMPPFHGDRMRAYGDLIVKVGLYRPNYAKLMSKCQQIKQRS